MASATLDARLRLNSAEFSGGLQKALKDSNVFVGKVNAQFRTLAGVFTGGIAGGLAGSFITKAIGTAADREEMIFSLASVAGGLEAATAEFERLKALALEPGLTLESAVKGAARLQAVGMTAAEAEKALRALGNAVAMVGGGGPELEAAATALATIFDKGELSSKEVLKLAREIPTLRTAMESVWGTSNVDALEELNLSAREFVDLMVNKLAEAPKVMENLRDKMDTTKQKMDDAVESAGKFFSPFVDLLSGTLTAVVDIGTAIREGIVEEFGGWSEAQKKVGEEAEAYLQTVKKTREIEKARANEREESEKAAKRIKEAEKELKEALEKFAEPTFDDFVEEAKKRAKDVADALEEHMYDSFTEPTFDDFVKEAKDAAQEIQDKLNEAFDREEQLFDDTNLDKAEKVIDDFKRAVDLQMRTPAERKEDRRELREERRAARHVLRDQEREELRKTQKEIQKGPLGERVRGEDRIRDIRQRFHQARDALKGEGVKAILKSSDSHLSNIEAKFAELVTF